MYDDVAFRWMRVHGDNLGIRLDEEWNLFFT